MFLILCIKLGFVSEVITFRQFTSLDFDLSVRNLISLKIVRDSKQKAITIKNNVQQHKL